MADIFVSYKREDQEQKGRIIPIVRALEAEGFDVFYDVEIPPGSTWEKVLQTKIDMAKCVLVMWSEASVASDWVKEEAEIAKMAGKIIPVFLDPVNAPFGFSRIEGANLIGWDGDLDDVEWRNLVSAIKSRVGEGGGTKRPEVKHVPMPVEPPSRSSGSSGIGKLLIGAALMALIGVGGFYGYSWYQGSAKGGVNTGKTPTKDDTAKQRELRAFEKAKSTNTIAMWSRFIRAYPDGAYITEAKAAYQKLIDAQKATPTPTPTRTVRPTPAIAEDCLTYSGAYRVDSSTNSARLVDAAGRGTPLSATGATAVEEMTLALNITKSYRLMSQCFVSRPNPPFRYWKTPSGDIPSGAVRGEDCISFDPTKLQVKLRNGAYYVMSENSSMIRFMTTANATKAVKILKQYGATKMCYVGRPDPSMMYIRK